MIGVAVQPHERAATEELFELCKTPWKFFEADGKYDVVISTSEVEVPDAALVIRYSANPPAARAVPDGARPRVASTGAMLAYGNERLPIYGQLATFAGSKTKLIRDEATQAPVLLATRIEQQTRVQVGYNLFAEISHLLTAGQPVENARFPSLDLHIALLRDIITRAGLPMMEIPPVPAGHRFTVCLTHDIDHPLLRNHRWDHTMFGFLFRAAVMSPIAVCRGRTSLGRMLRNWGAVIRLPFVHLGLAADPWSEFDRYLEIEEGLGATYFVIPERGNPGRKKDGRVAAKRASRYKLSEIAPQLRRIIAAGKEVALHGLSSWMDGKSGRREKEKLSESLSVPADGIRMHWLYFDQDSHAALEEAGFCYDSTIGYNETVGYRAGTAQAYRPLRNTALLELPLHVMDTALFYPSYLNLSETEAFRRVDEMIGHVERFGGVLTINWHDRSIFPERLWGGFYRSLLNEMKHRQAWFPTASQAVAWYRKRRAVSASSIELRGEHLTGEAAPGECDSLPGLTLRTHHPCPRLPNEALAAGQKAAFSDAPFHHSIETG